MDPIHILGLHGSPYTRKMVAALRYRRIPFTLEWRHPLKAYGDRIAPKPALLPTLYFAGDPNPVTDTTPIIRRLEKEYQDRSILPDDPVMAMINALIEDYADEWLTKAMFHYRWRYDADIKYAADMIVFWSMPTLPHDQAAAYAKEFADRQIGRLRFVGSNEVTGPIIEAGYKRFLNLLNDRLPHAEFMFGARPSSADFAIYGQLTQLTSVDPTPMKLAEETSLRLRAWVHRLDDLSGTTPGDWTSDAEILKPFLREIGRVYAPLLLANDAAGNAGKTEFEAEIDGAPWRQNVFPYQRKCLAWLREEFTALSSENKRAFMDIVSDTGCETLFRD